MEAYDDDYVEAVANIIRKEFIKRKSAQMGKAHYRLHPKHDKPENWIKTARQCLALKATPENYIKACFDYCSVSRGPFAQSLAGQAARKWYAQFLNSVHQYNVYEDKNDVSVELQERAVRAQLILRINTAREIMKNLNGTHVPNEKNLNWVCARHTKLDPEIRVLLGYPDGRLKSLCGEEAYNEFISNELLRKAAESLGYPVESILAWLK